MSNVQGKVEPVNDEWSRPFVTTKINAYRTGWRGAWDAIKAAWKKQDRLQVVEDVTYSVYVRYPAEKVTIWGAQLEDGEVRAMVVPDE